MNRKIQDTEALQERRENGEFAVHRNYRTTIIAAIVCLLLGFVVWTVVMGFDDSDHIKLQVNTGVQNILNHFQPDLDQGEFRDSGYFYGPTQPRTLFIGFKIAN